MKYLKACIVLFYILLALYIQGLSNFEQMNKANVPSHKANISEFFQYVSRRMQTIYCMSYLIYLDI